MLPLCAFLKQVRLEKGRKYCFSHGLQIDMPEGFVVLGDAVATFNPIYAQVSRLISQSIGIPASLYFSCTASAHLHMACRTAGGFCQAAHSSRINR